MKKIAIDTNSFGFAMPMCLVGVVIDGAVNFMPVAWFTRVNNKPPMMGVAMGKNHFTNQGIYEHDEFSINIPDTSQVIATDYCGMVSGKRVDKSEVFAVEFGTLKHAPLIVECPLSMECKLVETVDLPFDELFIGEIIGTYAREDCLTDGKPDMKKINTYSLSMPDNNYWSLGSPIEKAWSCGKKYSE